MLSKLTALFHGHLPQLIGFDLDGTLVDSARDLTTSIDRMLLELGRTQAGEDKVRQWVGNGAAMLVARALADSSDPSAVEQVETALAEDGLARFRRIYAEENGNLTCLYDGVSEVLEAISGLPVKLALITNKPLVFTQPLLQELGIDGYFQLVLGGECLAEKKPHPLPLRHCAQQLGALPEMCLMVGDSRNDIDAAKAAGWRSVAVSYGYNHGEPVSLCGPDWLVEDFRELLL